MINSYIEISSDTFNSYIKNGFCICDAFGISYLNSSIKKVQMKNETNWISTKKVTESYVKFLNEIESFRLDEFQFQLPPHYQKNLHTWVYQLNAQTKKIIRSVDHWEKFDGYHYPTDLCFFKSQTVGI